MAMAAMDAVRERGMRIPEDISIIGFDDIPQASLIRPSLTTIRQPLEQMGRIAAQMLFEILRNPDHKYKRVELPTELIVRDSIAKPKGKVNEQIL
jgi:LacI family transcriptional regulator